MRLISKLRQRYYEVDIIAQTLIKYCCCDCLLAVGSTALIVQCVYARFKGSREITDSNKFEIVKEGDKQILVVHEVYGEDADEYSVRASNKGGNRVSRADLEISCEQHNFLFFFVTSCSSSIFLVFFL